jgi:hypothetical protein
LTNLHNPLLAVAEWIETIIPQSLLSMGIKFLSDTLETECNPPFISDENAEGYLSKESFGLIGDVTSVPLFLAIVIIYIFQIYL